MTSPAEVSANVQIKPRGSQVFLVSLSVLSAVCFGLGAWLLSDQNTSGYWFVAAGVLLPLSCFPFWWRSQSDIDQGAPHPTTIALSNGNVITLDSRLLVSGTAIDGLGRLAEVFNRQPLPAPDGLIDANKQVIPNSSAEAVAKVNALNQETHLRSQQIAEALNITVSSSTDQPIGSPEIR